MWCCENRLLVSGMMISDCRLVRRPQVGPWKRCTESRRPRSNAHKKRNYHAERIFDGVGFLTFGSIEILSTDQDGHLEYVMDKGGGLGFAIVESLVVH